jgi:hypothetical protein
VTSLHFLIMAGIVWRVVRLKHRPRGRAGAGRAAAPWLVALASDAVLFAGLAYREHRRKIRAGKPTAVRDRRKSTWTKSTPLGGDDRAGRPRPGRRVNPADYPDMEIPF